MILVPSNKWREDGPACDKASHVAGEWLGDGYPVPLPLKFKSRSREAYRPSG
jgi:hypothetical protein